MKFKSKLRAMRQGMFKLFMTMKLVVAIIILTVLQAGAKSIAKVITIKKKNISLDKALTLIENETGYHFIYDTKLEQFKSNTVSVDINKGSISAVLDQCI